jgi:asparagine synthase (glutamine-hydrolysing)
VDELYALLKESVRLRLISDVPLGAFLSGGIDSSAIVGLMRELGASPLKTFSIGFRDRTYDELDHARRIARRFATDHEEFVCEPRALELAETLVRHLDEPLADFSIFPTYLVSKMAREHVTVILSGDGGDELFGGYEHYQAQRLAGRALVRPAGRLAGLLLRKLPPGEKKKGLWNKLRRLTSGLGEPARLRHLRWMTFQTPRTKAALATGTKPRSRWVGESRTSSRLFGLRPPRGFTPTNAELYLDLKTYLVDDIVVRSTG